MKFWPIIIFLSFFLGLSGCSNQPSNPAEFFKDISVVRYQFGDEPGWASFEFDDSGWAEANISEVKSRGKILWARTHFQGSDILDKQKSQPIGVHIMAMAASDIYLNGELIAQNGQPGLTAVEEIPGRLDAVFFIPREKIRPGENVLAFRLSSQHMLFDVHTNLYFFMIYPYENSTADRLDLYIPALPLFGLFLIGAFFFTFRGILGRFEASSFWLGLASLFVAAQMGAEVSRGLINYTYDWHLIRIAAIALFAFGFGLSLTIFSGFYFLKKFPKKAVGFGVLGTILIFLMVPGFDGKTAITLAFFFLLAIGVGVYSWFRGGRKGNPVLIVLAIVLALVLPSYGLFLDRYYFFMVSFILLALFTLEVLAAQDRERKMNLALVHSARVELELLKRHIQPHFLMNTLTALAEWMEKNPKVGGEMIDALAEEFRLLHDMTAEKLVALEKELALCKAHLKLIGFRKNTSLYLTGDIKNEQSLVPPAIFHTLIENALTHGKLGTSENTFKLDQKIEKGLATYTFTAPLGKKVKLAPNKTGFGTAYIEARLEEAFPGDFEIEQGPLGTKAWVTTITIPDKKASR